LGSRRKIQWNRQDSGDENCIEIKKPYEVFNIGIIHTKPEHFATFANLPLIKTHNDPMDRIIHCASHYRTSNVDKFRYTI
jgi:PIN domain nuclease of toxin-antitoxin system